MKFEPIFRFLKLFLPVQFLAHPNDLSTYISPRHFIQKLKNLVHMELSPLSTNTRNSKKKIQKILDVITNP